MQEQKYPIKDWAKDDRPREKLLSKSPMDLSDSELLAILIHHGTRERSAADLAREVLQLGGNNLHELGKIPVRDLMKIKGIGETKAVTISAALELGRRRQKTSPLHKPVIRDSEDVALYLQAVLKDLDHEIFAVLYLNRANRLTHFEIVSRGGLSATVADPRVILKKAIEKDAISLILCHNHPSGSSKPSRADTDLTQKIREAARFFDIRVMDHIIVGESGYYSFADEGTL